MPMIPFSAGRDASARPASPVLPVAATAAAVSRLPATLAHPALYRGSGG